MFFKPAPPPAADDNAENWQTDANAVSQTVADGLASEGEWLSAAEIFGVIKSKVGATLKVTNLMTFGRKLANMPELPKRRFTSGMKYRVVRIYQ